MNKYISTKVYTILAVLMIISGCTTVYQSVKSPDFEALYGPSKPKQRYLIEDTDLAQGAISYHNDIKPILDSRCVACHACYDAPCQLKLGSTAGIDRGATKQLVYDGGRLKAIEPTRLFIDAINTQGWRDKEFYPVLNERKGSTQAALNNSLLAKLIQLKRDKPLPDTGKLADSFDLSLERTLECPTVEEFDKYKNKHPDWGMPYAMPGLSLKQEYTLMTWLQEGAKFDAQPPLSVVAVAAIKQWEHFFNRPSLKQKLVSRYIYEHLFIGHIHFKGQADEEFYRMVRSTTPPGQPVNEIATLLPYDDPGVTEFYYRLRPVEATIVEKTHFVYELSKDKMQRYDELFFQADYSVTKLPSYQAEIAASPFLAFAEIPYLLRYQFLLDDAQYFVSGFIKGPVCRGQMALDSIRDRFWIAFFKPGGAKGQPDKAKALHNFLTKQYATLSLPGTAGHKLGLFGFHKYDDLAEQYLKNKDAFANHLIEEFGGFQMEDIWDGEGSNQNAALTVFRHFDSATVVTGLVGDIPLTGWVVDYPIFERLHYLLVAGFDVYSSVDHQLASRKYMDFFRMDGENNFLRFMPADQRKEMHDSWYKGISGKIASYIDTPYYSAGYETGVNYQTTRYKKEFFNQLRQRLGKAAGDKDILNQCDEEACISKEASSLQQDIDVFMRKLAQFKGHELDVLPEMSLVRVRTKQEHSDLVYTLLLNKSLENITFMIGEDDRRERGLDTLTVIPGFLGSYPNFFFNVQEEQLPEFIEAIKHIQSSDDKEAFYSKYGIRRTNPEIWQYVDWFNAQHKKYRGVRAGLFDLNRYHNL
ncbi:MAG: isomerase [Methyloprofundus sp.]|nr:isomerase [Methyloprofundus sp.]